MSGRKYKSPDWGAPAPAGVWSLEVVRDGVVVAVLPLDGRTRGPGETEGDRDHWIVGRDDTVADVHYPHGSISRQHAVIQHSAEGEMYVTDLGSTYGTHLGKTALQALVYAQLPVGSVLRFGEASRLYILVGPEAQEAGEVESEALRQSRLAAEERQKRKEEERKAREEAGGASWGFGDDAEVDDEESAGDAGGAQDATGEVSQELGKSTLDASKVHAKDRKLFERIQARRKKVENLDKEKTRILYNEAKSGGATDGQTRRLEQIEQARLLLLKQIQEGEDTINSRGDKRGESKNAKHAREDEAALGDSDDDDFYDRTEDSKRRRARRDGSSTQVAETASSLRRKITDLDKQIADVQAKLAAKHAEIADLDQGETDELEAFMTATRLNLLREESKTLAAELQEHQSARSRFCRLLKIAEPALGGLVAKGESEAAPAEAAAAAGIDYVAPAESHRTAAHGDQEKAPVTEDKVTKDDTFASRFQAASAPLKAVKRRHSEAGMEDDDEEDKAPKKEARKHQEGPDVSEKAATVRDNSAEAKRARLLAKSKQAAKRAAQLAAHGKLKTDALEGARSATIVARPAAQGPSLPEQLAKKLGY